MATKPPKFKVGQVVSVSTLTLRSIFCEHGHVFGKIVKILVSPNKPPFKPTAPHCYFLCGWLSAQTENDLRALTKREMGVSPPTEKEK
jgi:hypothetical protein